MQEKKSESMRDSIQITWSEGRPEFEFKKARLKGKVTQSQLLDAILIAARMQAEKYIEKLARGAPLDTFEIKALKDLADIAKIQLDESVAKEVVEVDNQSSMQDLKASIYEAITAKITSPKF